MIDFTSFGKLIPDSVQLHYSLSTASLQLPYSLNSYRPLYLQQVLPQPCRMISMIMVGICNAVCFPGSAVLRLRTTRVKRLLCRLVLFVNAHNARLLLLIVRLFFLPAVLHANVFCCGVLLQNQP